jgi:phytoene dehydrogenase-like protein
MLRPEVIRDLNLASFGLRMVPCDPFLQVPFHDGQIIRWWADRDRTAEEIKKYSPRDAKTFLRVDGQLKKLARYLQPFFLESPPQVGAPGVVGLLELLRVGKRFRTITADEIGQFISFLTGSLRAS